MDKQKIESQSPCLDVERVSVNFSSAAILRNISFSIAKMETVAIIGASGSGKTTLLRSLALFARPHLGSLRLDGQVYWKDGEALFESWEVRRRISLVAQDYPLLPNLTGLRNITLVLQEVRRMSPSDATDWAISLAGDFGLSLALLERFPESYSGGQAQRVALIRALAVRPKILLLDEVTSALDPESVNSVVNAIRMIQDDPEYGKVSILLATHLMSFAQEFSDRTLFISQGSILESGESRSLFSSPKSRELTRFLKSTRVPY